MAPLRKATVNEKHSGKFESRFHQHKRESVKNDVSVPVSRVAELLERAPEIVERTAPGARPCPFGHIGDGNIHYNILGPADLDPKTFRQRYGERARQRY